MLYLPVPAESGHHGLQFEMTSKWLVKRFSPLLDPVADCVNTRDSLHVHFLLNRLSMIDGV
jgi:hypothetical protein